MTAGERARRQAAVAAQLADLRRVKSPEEYDLWQAGRLVPARITQLLDVAGLEGPEVDLACGAAEPDVDRWEAGELYPTWEQTCRLADLLGVTVEALCREPMSQADIGPVFICPRPNGWVGRLADQRLTFAPQAVDRVVTRLF